MKAVCGFFSAGRFDIFHDDQQDGAVVRAGGGGCRASGTSRRAGHARLEQVHLARGAGESAAAE